MENNNWIVSPEIVTIQYEQGKSRPAPIFVQVVGPEYSHSDFTDYNIRIENNEFVEIISGNQTDDITTHYYKFNFLVSPKDLNAAPLGVTELNIEYTGTGYFTDEDPDWSESNHHTSKIRIIKTEENYHLPNKVLNVIYNQKNGELTGDTNIDFGEKSVGKTLTFELEGENQGIAIESSTDTGHITIEKAQDIESVFTEINRSYSYRISVKTDSEVLIGYISVVVKVIGFESDYIDYHLNSNYNFCLSKDSCILFKKFDETSDRLRMKIEMKMNQQNSNIQNLTEVYEYYLIEDEIKIFPGEEINDFFLSFQQLGVKANKLTRISSVNVITPRPLFSMALCNITIEEFAPNWELKKVHNLGESWWIPGDVPKAYPYLTNGFFRRTYSDSIISICAIKEDFQNYELHKVCTDVSDFSEIEGKDNWIVQANFKRETADLYYHNKKIINHSGLSLFPIKNTQKTINVIFENQNLCPDWFSFAENYKIETEIDFLMSQNIARGRKFKANVESNKKLILNTGWILIEEIDLLEELCKSSICFVNIDPGIWLKCIPTQKKALQYDSEKRLYQQLVEFEIIDNER